MGPTLRQPVCYKGNASRLLDCALAGCGGVSWIDYRCCASPGSIPCKLGSRSRSDALTLCYAGNAGHSRCGGSRLGACAPVYEHVSCFDPASLDLYDSALLPLEGLGIALVDSAVGPVHRTSSCDGPGTCGVAR